MKTILVLVKTDGGTGTATLMCRGLQQDPFFPDKVVLVGIQGLSWPFAGKFLKVNQWSVNRDVVLNWQSGVLSDTFDISPDMISGGEGQPVPWSPGTLPNRPLVNHPEEIVGTEEEPGELGGKTTPTPAEIAPLPDMG